MMKTKLFLASFLLLPAFMFGLTFLWSIGYSVISAKLLQKKLEELISNASTFSMEEKEKSMHTLGRLVLLLTLCIAVLSAPQFLIYAFFDKVASVNVIADTVVYNFLLSFFLEGINYAEFSGLFKLATVSMFAFIVCLPVTVILTIMKFDRVGRIIVFYKNDRPKDCFSKEYWYTYCYYDFFSGLYGYLFIGGAFLPFIIYYNCMVNDISVLWLLFAIPPCIYVTSSSFAFSNIMCDRQFAHIKE